MTLTDNLFDADGEPVCVAVATHPGFVPATVTRLCAAKPAVVDTATASVPTPSTATVLRVRRGRMELLLQQWAGESGGITIPGIGGGRGKPARGKIDCCPHIRSVHAFTCQAQRGYRTEGKG